jgi:hypothetical protein
MPPARVLLCSYIGSVGRLLAPRSDAKRLEIALTVRRRTEGTSFCSYAVRLEFGLGGVSDVEWLEFGLAVHSGSVRVAGSCMF